MNFVDYLIKDKKNLNKEIFINKNLRYSDLYDYIKSLKHLTKGKKNNIFAICFENSEEFLINYLSLIKSENVPMIIEKGLSVKKYLEILDRFDINFFITDNSLIKDNLSNSFKEELFRTDFTNKKSGRVSWSKSLSIFY